MRHLSTIVSAIAILTISSAAVSAQSCSGTGSSHGGFSYSTPFAPAYSSPSFGVSSFSRPFSHSYVAPMMSPFVASSYPSYPTYSQPVMTFSSPPAAPVYSVPTSPSPISYSVPSYAAPVSYSPAATTYSAASTQTSSCPNGNCSQSISVGNTGWNFGF